MHKVVGPDTPESNKTLDLEFHIQNSKSPVNEKNKKDKVNDIFNEILGGNDQDIVDNSMQQYSQIVQILEQDK